MLTSMAVSTVTSRPSWASMVTPMTPGKGVQRVPKPRTNTAAADASAVQSQAVRAATAASSHNVFRPDIFRVSEGYLN